MATIGDVARRAGVSTATVSRVVNEHPAVRVPTRNAVLAAIKELGYTPNPVARNLRRSRSGAIGVVLPHITNPSNLAILHGIASAAAVHGVSLFICDSAGSVEAEERHIVQLCDRRVDGIVLHPIGSPVRAAAMLAELGVPLAVGAVRQPIGGLRHVVVDEYDASVSAIELLISLGHRRIALALNGFRSGRIAAVGTMRHRYDAYCEAHARAGLQVDEGLVQVVDSADAARTIVRSLLDGENPPTAVVSGTHMLAPGLLLGIRDAGLTIGRDASFLTYGDSMWAQAFDPALTVIRADFERVGRALTDLVMAELAGEAGERAVHEQAELLVRGSCAPAPERGKPVGTRRAEVA